MENMTLQLTSASVDFSEARRQAVDKAGERLARPVIIAWHDDRSKLSGPVVPGGTEDRWHDYGESYGGKLELTVADDYHFIFAEAEDFEEPDLNLSSIHEQDGTTILCLNEACTEEDKERLGYFQGGGMGG